MYRVSDSKICSKCSVESDTILHALWNCRFVVPYLDTIFTFLKAEYKLHDLETSVKNDIFGGQNLGLNQVVLELKKELFYNKETTVNKNQFLNIFLSKIRTIMIKEKLVMFNGSKGEEYISKWENL